MKRGIKKRMLDLVLAILWFLTTILLLRESVKFMPFNSAFFTDFIGLLLVLLGITIMLGWKAAGIFGGTVFFILSSLVSSIIGWGTGLLRYLTLILFNLSIWFGLYFYYRALRRLSRNVAIKMDEISAKKNVTVTEIERHKLLTEALNKKISRYFTLKGLIEALSSTLHLEEIAGIVAENTFKIIGKSDTCLLFLIDQESHQLGLVSSKTSDSSLKIKSKKGDIFDNWVVKQRQGLLVLDAKKDFRFNIGEIDYQRDFRSIIASPVCSENKITGVLRLDSMQPDNYSPDDLRLLNVISNLAAISIQNALLFKKTEELAIRDGLTGLFVKRHFLQMYEEEYQRALRANYPLSMLMIDIDLFKNYNDKFGHTAGDIVLKRVASILNSIVREEDLIARYGGEEFVVALPKTTKKEATLIAEKLRVIIESEIFLLRREKTVVTVSIGVANFPADVRGKEDLIREADLCLLKAKREGRNRVCAA